MSLIDFQKKTYFFQFVSDLFKIIIKARKNHLFNEYKAKSPQITQVTADVQTALAVIEEKLAAEEDKDKKEMYSKMIAKVQATLKKYAETKQQDTSELLENATEVLSTWLDKLDGHNVTDNSIFNKLPRHFEGEFHKDMVALNVTYLCSLN